MNPVMGSAAGNGGAGRCAPLLNGSRTRLDRPIERFERLDASKRSSSIAKFSVAHSPAIRMATILRVEEYCRHTDIHQATCVGAAIGVFHVPAPALPLHAASAERKGGRTRRKKTNAFKLLCRAAGVCAMLDGNSLKRRRGAKQGFRFRRFAIAIREPAQEQ